MTLGRTGHHCFTWEVEEGGGSGCNWKEVAVLHTRREGGTCGHFVVSSMCFSLPALNHASKGSCFGLSLPLSQGDLVSCWCLVKLCLFNKRTARPDGGARWVQATSRQPPGQLFLTIQSWLLSCSPLPPLPQHLPVRTRCKVLWIRRGGPRPPSRTHHLERRTDRPASSLPGRGWCPVHPRHRGPSPDTDTCRGYARPLGWLLTPSAVTKHLSVTAPAINSSAGAAWRSCSPGAPGVSTQPLI